MLKIRLLLEELFGNPILVKLGSVWTALSCRAILVAVKSRPLQMCQTVPSKTNFILRKYRCAHIEKCSSLNITLICRYGSTHTKINT